MEDAIRREKRLKKWNRAWKFRLINSMNPQWDDLFDEFWGALRNGPADQMRSRELKCIADPRLRGDDGVGEGSHLEWRR